jgi:hypothetical protein
MSSTQFEAFLARLYVDAEARENFKANPRDESKKAGLSDEQCAALENLDWIGLEMAARSFARKRQLKRPELVGRVQTTSVASPFPALPPVTALSLS